MPIEAVLCLCVIVLLSVIYSMSAKLSPVAGFLRRTSLALKQPWNGRYNVVLGNQACDADSMISSLCYAYLSEKAIGRGSAMYVPACMLARQDLVFRNEVKLLLERVHASLDDLLCAEDINLLALHEKSALDLTLVDHNVLDTKLERLADSVMEIVDHHKDSNKYTSVSGTKRTIAFDKSTGKALVGSTCTLVFERFADVLRSEPDVATLLLGVIALDTINMDSAAGIGTDRDAEALRRLREISGQNQDELFETLRGAKTDPVFWQSLTPSEVLRIDYKAFNSPAMKQQGVKDIGIASILQPLKDFLAKENILSVMEQTLHEQDLSVLVVMSFVHQPTPTRELLFLTHDRALHDALAAYLQDAAKHDLDCAPMSIDHAPHPSGTFVTILSQRNAKASRKQVAPILLDFFDQYAESVPFSEL